MEAESTSETSISFYETTRRKILEDSHLHAKFWLQIWKGRENLEAVSVDEREILKFFLCK
jgi:hypothetical protein